MSWLTPTCVTLCTALCLGCNTASLHLDMTDEQVESWTQQRFRVGDSIKNVERTIHKNGLSVDRIGPAPDRDTFEKDKDRAMFVKVHKPGMELSNPLNYSMFPPRGTLRLYFTEQSELEVMHWIRPVKSPRTEWPNHFIAGDPIRIELLEAAP